MKIHFKFKQSMAGFLILAMLHLCWMSSFAWAEMVATDPLAQSQTEGQNPRQRLLDLLSREEVRKELEKHGISQVETVARVNSLTDEEVAEVVGRLDQLPNGGFVEVIVFLAYGGMAALGLALYFLGVIYKGFECLFYDCGANAVPVSSISPQVSRWKFSGRSKNV